ncbi:uncharacterized protein LOC112905057 [Agrilus planipennis]|uniref:Uncharacterized protein LOC112905057 n=1 Tax=Agrilus planipennis TaxID=224129 RepID=A0A7F5R909_AGRPL|nr:uncharacterized protein LOC112905057 [Agrilus planipennis]
MTVVKPLPRVILATNPFILFDIKVTKNNKESCSTGAAILVKLLPPPLPPLPINDGGFSFQRNTYVAFYKGDLELTFQQPILLVGQVNSVILRMQNSNYTNYFYVKSPFRKLVTIQLKQTLKRTDFDNGIILFDIVALSTNSLNSATASVVVVWDGPKTILIFFTDYLSGFVYIFLLLTILLAICAAIGFKLMHKTRRPVPSTALQPPPPYTPNSEEK